MSNWQRAILNCYLTHIQAQQDVNVYGCLGGYDERLIQSFEIMLPTFLKRSHIERAEMIND